MAIEEVVDWSTEVRGNKAVHPTSPQGMRADRISSSFQELQAAIARWRDSLGGGNIGGSISDNQVAVGSATAGEIEGTANLEFNDSIGYLYVGNAAGPSNPRVFIRGPANASLALTMSESGAGTVYSLTHFGVTNQVEYDCQGDHVWRIGGTERMRLDTNDLVLTNGGDLVFVANDVFISGTNASIDFNVNNARSLTLDTTGTVFQGAGTQLHDFVSTDDGPVQLRLQSDVVNNRRLVAITSLDAVETQISLQDTDIVLAGAVDTTNQFAKFSQNRLSLGPNSPQKTWQDASQGIELGIGATVSGTNSNPFLRLAANAYVNATPNWAYVADGEATSMIISDTDYVFRTAASGLADAVISWNEIARLNATGFAVKYGGKTLTLGADAAANSITNATLKEARVGIPHYNSDTSGDAAVFYAYSTATDNELLIGGGTISYNAATIVDIWAAANNVTPTGSRIARFTTSGLDLQTGNLQIPSGQQIRIGDSGTYITGNSTTNEIGVNPAGSRTVTFKSSNAEFGTDASFETTGTTGVTIEGDSTGFSNAFTRYIANHASSVRAMGNYAYNVNTDVEWFWGRPYPNNDAFSILRRTGGLGPLDSTADVATATELLRLTDTVLTYGSAVGAKTFNINAQGNADSKIALQQNGIDKAAIRFENSTTTTEFTADFAIALRPGNVTALTLSTSQIATFASHVDLANGFSYRWGDSTTRITGNASTDIIQMIAGGSARLTVDTAKIDVGGQDIKFNNGNRLYWGDSSTHIKGNATTNAIIIQPNNVDRHFFYNDRVELGNYEFDTDQTVGAGQDNYVLTYDHNGGVSPQIRLEAAASGGGITFGTPNSPTGVGTVTFSGIPSGVKRITIVFVDLSGTAGAELRVRLGDSGGIETTGYKGGNPNVTSAPAHDTGFFPIASIVTGAFDLPAGQITLTRLDDGNNTWVLAGHVLYDGSLDDYYFPVGRKTTSAALDRVEIYWSTGNFDAGTINILYEE